MLALAYAFAAHIISEKGVDIINEEDGGAAWGEAGGALLSTRAFVFFSIDQTCIDCLVDTFVVAFNYRG